MEQPVFEGRPGKLPHWASNLEENVPWTNRTSEHPNLNPKMNEFMNPYEFMYPDVS